MVYLVSSVALRLPFAEEISLRMAPIIGFALFAFSLAVFVGRRLGVPYGLVAGSIVLTGTYTEFALQARPYGMLVGFVGLALVGWQAAADEKPRWRAAGLIGLAIGLTGALLSHVFAILLYVPFAAAEIWRWRERRRQDWGVGLVLLCSSATGIFYPPLLHASRHLTLAGPLYSLSLLRVFQSYGLLLMTVIEFLPVLLILWLIASKTRGAAEMSWKELGTRIPKREIVLAAALASLPVCGYVVGYVAHAPVFSRYALAFIGGFAILLTYAAYGWGRGKSDVAWMFAGTVSICLIFPILQTYFSPQRPPRQGQVGGELLQHAEGHDSIVVSSGITFLELDRYLPPAVACRLVFIAEPDFALRRVFSDGVDRPLAISVPWTKPLGKVEGYAEFISSHKVFWWYGNGQDPLEWTLAQWKDDGARIETVATEGSFRLNRIRLPGY
jgi:MFS family permease